MDKRHQPKLGQHFLADTRYCSRMVEALDLRANEIVVEIGPGHGAVTELLASRAQSVVAIEVDYGLMKELRQKFDQTPHVEILHADILSTDIGAICRQRNASQCYIFGNLPYYITSPIIHHVLGFADHVRAMGLLVQHEVAKRLVAQPGSRDYGYLTLLVHLHSSPRIVFQVPAGAFSPPPKVQSTFVHFALHPIQEGMNRKEEQEFLTFLKQSFAHKRKKLLNCLSPVYPRQRIEQEIVRLALPLTVRAEQVSLEQFMMLFSHLR